MKRITTALLAAIGVHQHLSAEQKSDIGHAHRMREKNHRYWGAG